MATLSMIDTTKSVTLRAHSRSQVMDSELVELSKRLNMPRLLNVSSPVCGAQELRIEDSAGFLTWLSATAWLKRLEEELQCVSQDRDGRPILTALINMGEFEQLVADAKGSKYGAALQQAIGSWMAIGADEIAFEGYKH